MRPCFHFHHPTDPGTNFRPAVLGIASVASADARVIVPGTQPVVAEAVRRPVEELRMRLPVVEVVARPPVVEEIIRPRSNMEVVARPEVIEEVKRPRRVEIIERAPVVEEVTRGPRAVVVPRYQGLGPMGMGRPVSPPRYAPGVHSRAPFGPVPNGCAPR